MRALLIKDWGGYRAGQVLTAYPPEAIPADLAVWYGDDEVVPVPRVVNSAVDLAEYPEIAARLAKPEPVPEPEPAAPRRRTRK